MAASSSTSTCYPCYDVFINHRGCDVKNTFASDLYRRLCDFELQVFLDKDELVKGLGITPQIDESIKRASVQIAIFSPNYAESVWCLDELVSMLKSRATIIPVFYQVDPSVLRRTIGTYGHALQKLEQKTSEGKQRYEADRIQSWRNALSSVADISGFVLSGDEGQLLDEVVNAVMKNVSKTPLDVARYSTGLAKKLEDFESMLSEQEEVKTEGAKVVGIWGVGGIGKTTLAKHFFNLKRSEYASSCFLSEVRENARRTRSLGGLQSELLHTLKPKKTIKISPDGAGIGILKKHLLGCHALVILEGACSLQSLPNSFGKLTQLKHLNLRCCTSLKVSSETLRSISTLVHLNLKGCKNVNDSLFSQAARQPSLKTLLLEGTDLKQFPRAIGDLANLEALGLGGNISGMINMIEEFLPLLHCLGNLRVLSISSCSELKSLPDAFGLLTQLEDLSVNDCRNLKCLSAALGQLTQLKKLWLWNCGIEHLPENLLSLNNLQDLDVRWCPLREVPFKKVESEREGGGELNKLDSKDKCMFGLTKLSLYKVKISEVAFPEGVCPNLRFLHLDCEQLREMEICGLANLRTLRITHCANLEELPSLETLVSLECIEVVRCPKVKLPGVERVMSLKVLDVQDCSKLQWDDAVLEKLRPIMKELYRGSIPFRNCIGRQFLLRCCRRF